MSSLRIRGLFSFFFFSFREKKLLLFPVVKTFSAWTIVPTGVTPLDTDARGTELAVLDDMQNDAFGGVSGFFAADGLLSCS